MNMFLLLVLLVAGEGVYFEYNQQKQVEAGIEKQLTAWQTTVNGLDAEIRDLTNAKNDILKATAQAEADIEKSNMTLAKAQSMIVLSKAEQEAKAAEEAGALGTIVTKDGQTYKNCQLLKVYPDGITFNHDDGITKVLFPQLPPALQKRFGYDPQAQSALQAAQMRYQEQLRAANGGGANPPAQ